MSYPSLHSYSYYDRCLRELKRPMDEHNRPLLWNNSFRCRGLWVYHFDERTGPTYPRNATTGREVSDTRGGRFLGEGSREKLSDVSVFIGPNRCQSILIVVLVNIVNYMSSSPCPLCSSSSISLSLLLAFCLPFFPNRARYCDRHR
jgi:hypothetical protein